MKSKMNKEEMVNHMKKIFEQIPTDDLSLHMEVIAKVLADRVATENKGKNLVLDFSHMKVMQ
jgi:hypothetical protein